MHGDDSKTKASYGVGGNKPGKFVKTKKLPDLAQKNNTYSNYEENKSVNHGKNSLPSDNEDVILIVLKI